MLLLLLAGEEARLRRQDLSTPFDDTAAALTARPATSTSRGEVDVFALERIEERTPDGYFGFFLPVDRELDIARRDELALSHEQDDDKQ